MNTGFGAATSSGLFYFETMNAGADGVSGYIKFSTGTSSNGDTGYFSVMTGDATQGKGPAASGASAGCPGRVSAAPWQGASSSIATILAAAHCSVPSCSSTDGPPRACVSLFKYMRKWLHEDMSSGRRVTSVFLQADVLSDLFMSLFECCKVLPLQFVQHLRQFRAKVGSVQI